MRIIYVVFIHYISRRASAIQVINTCWELARRGRSVDLVIPYDGGVTEEEILRFYGLEPIEGLTLVRVPPCPLSISYWLDYAWFHAAAFFKLLARRLSGRSASILYLRTDYAWPVLSLLAPAARLLRVKIIAEAHHVGYLSLAEKGRLFRGAGAAPSFLVTLCRVCEAIIFRNASGIVASTGNLARMIRDEFKPRCPVAVCPNGARLFPGLVHFDGERLRGQTVKLVYIGGLYKWKGIETAIRAMEYLPDSVGLDLLGFRPHEEREDIQGRERDFLVKIISETSSKDRIRMRGFVPPPDLPGVLSRYHIGLIPLSDSTYARYFTSPLKLFEYMACGLPIVASALPAIGEILKDGRNALLVKPSDPRALAEGIERLLEDREMAARIAGQAFADARDYTWERRAEKIGCLIEAVMAQTSG